MKDENDRLIKELQNVSPSELAATSVQQTVSYEPQQEQAYSAAEQELKKDRPLSLDKDARLYVPKNIVANAYSRQRQTTETIASSPMPLKVEQKEEVKELTMEQQALNLAKQGKSTEEIAKQLQKGKTEIELLLKFHH
ncbi:hypothetical protein Bsph_1582 [Lysinibacillus sphaericus C3-41]|nr:hypothetical protein [Lysinibacillus sphaericus]ACA39180.1 hypothetical protein Bsph_1582 [Lysinibacillus sphaericus C3-41]